RRQFPQKAIVVFLCLTHFLQRFLPTLLQRSRHESVLGLHGVVLPLGSLGFMPGALDGLTPLVVEAFPLLLDVLDSADTEIERGRFQSTEHLARDQVVERCGRDVPTRLVQSELPIVVAVIAWSLVCLVAGGHAAAALAAYNQARQ